MQKPNCQRTKNVSWPHVSSHEAGGNFILPLGGVLRRYRSVEILPQLRAGVNNSFEIFFRRRRANVISRRGIAFRRSKDHSKIFSRAAEFFAEIFSIFARALFFASGNRARRARNRRGARSAGKLDRFSPIRHSMTLDNIQRGQKTGRGYGTSVISGRGDNLRVERSCAGRITSRGAASDTSRMARAFHMKLEMSTTNFLSGKAESKMLS